MGVVQVIAEDALGNGGVHAVDAVANTVVFAQVDSVQHARVEALPPLADVGGQQGNLLGIVGHAQFTLVVGHVGAKGALVPPPTVFMMKGHAIAHALGANRGLPLAQQIAMRAEVDRVP